MRRVGKGDPGVVFFSLNGKGKSKFERLFGVGWTLAAL